ncbi:MAG: hypothetical protein LBP37_03410 [Spirochaetaceae bacterium]|nr:hypothetical protein [Spirochaetaceae bacterium]
MKYIYATLCSMVFLSACNQDPIFSMISNEIKPKPPLINGSPSKLVKSGGNIYVVNGKLWKYSNGGWSHSPNAPSSVFDIASGGSGLYLLSVNDGDTSVYIYNENGSKKIENPTEYDMIQSIHGDDSAVYAGAMKSGSNSYAILQVNGVSLSVKKEISSPLTGVAGSYFSTAINGIYNSSGGLVSGTSGYSIAGIIKIDGKILAATSSGHILEVNGNSVSAHSTGYAFTGGLAEYSGSGSGKLLLLGIKNNVYDMGYREMKLDGNYELSVPGDNASASTVSNRDKYRATLAKCAVNSLIQVNGELIFASTQKDGLWAYRDGEWNAED